MGSYWQLLRSQEFQGWTCPLEISDEDPLEIHLVVDAIGRKEFEPCSNMLPHADGEVLDDEVVIIYSSGSVGEPEVFEPYTGVRLSGVPSDVGGRSEALWGSGRLVGHHA